MLFFHLRTFVILAIFPYKKRARVVFSMTSDVPIDAGFLSSDDGSPVNVDTKYLLPCQVSDTAALLWALESFLLSIDIVSRNQAENCHLLLVGNVVVYISLIYTLLT